MANKGTYLIEVDGVTVCEAQKVKLAGREHEPIEIHRGTRDHPEIRRGKWKVPEVEITQARALNNEGVEFARLFDNYLDGIDLTMPTIRIITLGEDGKTAIATDEYIECAPTKFTPGEKDAEGKEYDSFTVSFRPTDHRKNY